MTKRITSKVRVEDFAGEVLRVGYDSPEDAIEHAKWSRSALPLYVRRIDSATGRTLELYRVSGMTVERVAEGF